MWFRRAVATSQARSRACSTFRADAARSFPPGYRYAFPIDSTQFVKLSIEEVVKTLNLLAAATNEPATVRTAAVKWSKARAPRSTTW